MGHTVIFHVISLAKKLQKAMGFKVSPYSLSYSQGTALLAISLYQEISQQQIARLLQLEPASVVTLIDQLEKMHLAKRDSYSTDRRKYNINLTPVGQQEVKLLKNRIKQIDTLLTESLNKKEIAAFFAILEKMNNILDDISKKKGGENEVSRTNYAVAS